MAKGEAFDPSMLITWDESEGGNIEHLAEHGVSPEEFEQVLVRQFHARQVSEGNPRHWLCRGHTRAGRFLYVVFEYFADAHAVNPVTAYEPMRRIDR